MLAKLTDKYSRAQILAQKKTYICNVSMIIVFLKNKTPKYMVKYASTTRLTDVLLTQKPD